MEDDFSSGLAELFSTDTGTWKPSLGNLTNEMLGESYGDFKVPEWLGGVSGRDREFSQLSQEDIDYNNNLYNQIGGDDARMTGANYWGDNKPMYQNQILDGNKVVGSASHEVKKPNWFYDQLFPMVVKGFIGSAFAGAGGFGPMGGTGATAGSAAATNPALIDSYLGSAGYGASSASPSLLASVPSYLKVAVSGGVQGGINSAISGQGLKGVLPGAVGGGVSQGISTYNPAGKLGIENPYLGNIFNRTLSSGVKAGLTGGDAGQAMLGSAVTGGLNWAGKELGNYLGEDKKMDMFGSNGYGDTSMFSGNELSSGFGSYQPQQDFSSLLSNFGNNEPDPYSFYQGNISPDTFDFNSYQQGQTGQPIGTPSDLQSPVMSFFRNMMTQNGKKTMGAGLGDMAGSLMGLYQANRARKDMKGQIGNLQGMFGQDSSYSQALRNQLTRRDSAGGRRSQYGPREVELQAKLAEMSGRNAPQLQALYSGQQAQQAMMLRNLLQLGNQTGAFSKLGEMFGG